MSLLYPSKATAIVTIRLKPRRTVTNSESSFEQSVRAIWCATFSSLREIGCTTRSKAVLSKKLLTDKFGGRMLVVTYRIFHKRRRKIIALIPSKARAEVAALTFAAVAVPLPAVADAFFFSTGSPEH